MAKFGCVTVVGVGLIGGSVGRALRERGLASRVVGVGRSESGLAEAVGLGVIDEGTTDLARGVENAEVVVVCTPVTQVAALAVRAAALAPDGVLVTDGGSTKRGIVHEVESDPGAARCFVGAHPIAGSERKGPAHADPRLFDGRVCVLTPTPRTPPDRLARAREFWSALGCRLVAMDPVAHDEALALTSHLPHAVAAALAASVPADALTLAAGAYRDGTRVAGSDASLWTAIFLANRDPLLRALARYRGELDRFQHALESRDESELHAWWDAAKALRGRFVSNPTPAPVAPPLPGRTEQD